MLQPPQLVFHIPKTSKGNIVENAIKKSNTLITVHHKKCPGTKVTAGIPIVFREDLIYQTNDRSFEVATLEDGSLEIHISGCSWDKIVELKKDIITQNEGVQVRSWKVHCNGMNITEVDDEGDLRYSMLVWKKEVAQHLWNRKRNVLSRAMLLVRCFWCDASGAMYFSRMPVFEGSGI